MQLAKHIATDSQIESLVICEIAVCYSKNRPWETEGGSFMGLV